MIRILGLDPGFSRIGIALLEVSRTTRTVTGLRVFKTEKSTLKQKVLASDDNVRRAREIAVALRGIVLGPTPPNVICVESMSFPRNASAAAKVSLCWGVIVALADSLSLPITQASPQQVKKAICGRKDASKEDVEKALVAQFPDNDFEALTKGITKSDREHPFDALAAAVCCLDSEILRAMLQIS